MASDFTCSMCKKRINLSHTRVDGYCGGSGYGTTAEGQDICYECCATQDVERMNKDSVIYLYLSKKGDGYEVTNWPGTLVFKPYGIKEYKECTIFYFKHNNNGVWEEWYGRQSGRNGNVARCQKLKAS